MRMRGLRDGVWAGGCSWFPGTLQESADNCGPEVGLQGKDGLLEEACKKYQAATDLCATLHEVRGHAELPSHWNARELGRSNHCWDVRWLVLA